MPAACQTLISVHFVVKLHKYPVKLGAHLWVSPLFIQQILIAHHPTSEMLGTTVKQTAAGGVTPALWSVLQTRTGNRVMTYERESLGEGRGQGGFRESPPQAEPPVSLGSPLSSFVSL